MSESILSPNQTPENQLERDSSAVFDTELAKRLVSEAISWLGTPFQHQGKIKGVGVDCGNFVDLVADAIGFRGQEIPPDYHRVENGQVMLALLMSDNMTYQDRPIRLVLVPFINRRAGDIVAFCDEALREPDKPRHVAFIIEVTATTTFIVEAGKEKVVRHRLDNWWNQRIHSVWRATTK